MRFSSIFFFVNMTWCSFAYLKLLLCRMSIWIWAHWSPGCIVWSSVHLLTIEIQSILIQQRWFQLLDCRIMEVRPWWRHLQWMHQWVIWLGVAACSQRMQTREALCQVVSCRAVPITELMVNVNAMLFDFMIRTKYISKWIMLILYAHESLEIRQKGKKKY